MKDKPGATKPGHECGKEQAAGVLVHGAMDHTRRAQPGAQPFRFRGEFATRFAQALQSIIHAFTVVPLSHWRSCLSSSTVWANHVIPFSLLQIQTPDLASKPHVSLVTIGQSQYLTLSYRRYKWAGATFTIQISGDLQSWSSGASATTEVSRTDHGDGTETVVTRDNTPVNPNVRRMMRLRLQ